MIPTRIESNITRPCGRNRLRARLQNSGNHLSGCEGTGRFDERALAAVGGIPDASCPSIDRLPPRKRAHVHGADVAQFANYRAGPAVACSTLPQAKDGFYL